MNLHLTEKERLILIDVCGQWCEMLEEADEDVVTPMLNKGLGYILYKLYEGKNGRSIYEKYAKKSVRESELLNALLGKCVKIVLLDNSIHTGILDKSEYSGRYKLDRREMNRGDLCFYKKTYKENRSFEVIIMKWFLIAIVASAMGFTTARFGITVADVEFWLIALYGIAAYLVGIFFAWDLIKGGKAE